MEPSSRPSFWWFVLAILAGAAYAFGARIVDAIWPKKEAT